jgi:hypothetical protein
MNSLKIKQFILALTLALVAPLAAAVFQKGMTLEQAEAEVKAQLATGATLTQIAQRALAAGLPAGVATTAMINATNNASGVVTAMLVNNAPLQPVVNAALATGATLESVTLGATAANVPSTAIEAAIAASPTTLLGATPPTDTSTSTPTGTAGAGAGGGGTGASTASPS